MCVNVIGFKGAPMIALIWLITIQLILALTGLHIRRPILIQPSRVDQAKAFCGVQWGSIQVDVGRSCHFKGQIFQIAHLTQSS